MHTFITTVTLFLGGIHIERKYLALLFLCLMLLFAVLVLVQQGGFQHWPSASLGQYRLFADGPGTPWDGGDAPCV